MASSRIAELAQIISAKTAKVDKHLKEAGKPYPSFGIDALVDLGIAPDAHEVLAAKDAVLEASTELQDLLRGPRALLTPDGNLTSLQAVYRFDVASKFPIGEEISFLDLATKCGLPVLDLRRILRHAMVYHRVFCEPRRGFVAHTAASKLLVESKQMRDAAGLCTDDTWQAYAKTVEAMIKWPNQEPNETGFALANNTTDTYYEFFEKNPARMARFASAISGDASQEKSRPPPPLWIGENYPWAKTFPDFATIVDVGGSEGSTCIRLAEKFPHFKFISQDLPIVIKQGESKLPAELRDRVKLMPHDFFTEQPVVADAYLIKFCLHNWPDHYVAKILKALIPALRKGAKVIVNEGVLPETGTTGLLRESDIRAHDLLMMTLFNARERELDDWKQVITDADKRFEITNVFTQSTSTTTAIEITWAG